MVDIGRVYTVILLILLLYAISDAVALPNIELKIENPSTNIAFGDFVIVNGSVSDLTNVRWSLIGPYNGWLEDIPLNVSDDGTFIIKINTTDLYINQQACEGYYVLKVGNDTFEYSVDFILELPTVNVNISDFTPFPSQTIVISGTTNLAPTGSIFDDGKPNNVTIYIGPSWKDWWSAEYRFNLSIDENQSFKLEFTIPSEWHDTQCGIWIFVHSDDSLTDDYYYPEPDFEEYIQVLNDNTWVISSPGYYTLNQDTYFDGIYLLIESDNVIFDGNGHAISGDAEILALGRDKHNNSLSNVTVKNCSIEEGEVFFRFVKSGIIESLNVSFIGLSGVTNVIVRDNNVTASYVTDFGEIEGHNIGIKVTVSENVTIINNLIQKSESTGLLLSLCENCTITMNNISNNGIGDWAWAGIEIYHSKNNIIFCNQIINNEKCGILLFESENNTIYGNYFNNSNNTKIISYDDSYTNFWNSTEPVTYIFDGQTFTGYIGNYWSDYVGTDTDLDGLGDTPYQIGSSNIDYHPLIKPPQFYVFTTAPIPELVSAMLVTLGIVTVSILRIKFK